MHALPVSHATELDCGQQSHELSTVMHTARQHGSQGGGLPAQACAGAGSKRGIATNVVNSESVHLSSILILPRFMATTSCPEMSHWALKSTLEKMFDAAERGDSVTTVK